MLPSYHPSQAPVAGGCVEIEFAPPVHYKLPPLSKAMWRSLRPAGSPEAPFSARACPRLPQASVTLGQSACRVGVQGRGRAGTQPMSGLFPN